KAPESAARLDLMTISSLGLGREANSSPNRLFRLFAGGIGPRDRGELGAADPAVGVAVDREPVAGQRFLAGELGSGEIAVPVLVQPVEQRLARRGVPAEARARRRGAAGGAIFLRRHGLVLREGAGKGKKRDGEERSHGARE